MSTPLLSVIVPMYNTEIYMNACLSSIVDQGIDDVQIILIDDGSPDNSAALAQRWSRRDPRLILIEQDHQGLSAARNRGIAAAEGVYIAFCDADDIVTRGAYIDLISSLDATGSDFATGDVRRFNSDGMWPHRGYGSVFAETRTRTHISRFSDLVRDRMVWNKVFRRSFWQAHRFRFDLKLYEDAPVMMSAHVEARSVDVLSNVVYHWRVRDEGPVSTTQDRSNPRNAAGFMTMVLETMKVILPLELSVVRRYVEVMCDGDVADLVAILRANGVSNYRCAISTGMTFSGLIPSDVRKDLSPHSSAILNDLFELASSLR
ncbi:glycosyltransferase family 2 protein [Microbacterium enclense]|uniref:glycosyltransferase family 2 protein n=1 Tax=Microbacterium enclense TaxID=993073 RepID=UPI003F80D2B5